MARDDTWGLTWSGRWHKIDATRPGFVEKVWGSKTITYPYSLCGQILYSQQQIQQQLSLAHLRLEVSGHSNKPAPVCKRCNAKAARLAAQ